MVRSSPLSGGSQTPAGGSNRKARTTPFAGAGQPRAHRPIRIASTVPPARPLARHRLILGLASELVIPDVAAASDVSGLLRE